MQTLGFVCKCEACEQPHKYPLSDTFQIKDPGAYCHSLNPQLEKEVIKLVKNDDVDAALKQFRLACDYLDDHAEDYPSVETSNVQSLWSKSFQVFYANIHDAI
jgi:hypothetical protein